MKKCLDNNNVPKNETQPCTLTTLTSRSWHNLLFVPALLISDQKSMQGGSVSWEGGILEMRAEIGNARYSWNGGNVETRGKFRVKENWWEKQKKDKDKRERKSLRKDLKKEREKVASNENMQKRKKYLQEGINVRGGGWVSFCRCRIREFCSSGSRSSRLKHAQEQNEGWALR